MSSNTAFLVGFMGSGKSSILNILKLNTEIHTIDLDDYVLRESKDDLESIEQLFEKHGEEYFRDCEVKAFQKIYQNPNTVVSLGGGSMISSPIKSAVLKSERAFYLKNEFDFIVTISHIDKTRDMVDQIIDITKLGGFSSIRYL